jgi:hypothetical protein
MSSKDREQQERREVMENDRKVRGDTFFARAQADADEQGGRFARQSPVTVTGTDAVPIFPKLTSSSPFSSDPVPTEPALGFSVNELPVIGGPPEATITSASGTDGSTPTNTFGRVEPSSFETIAHPPLVDDGLSRQPLVRKRI